METNQEEYVLVLEDRTGIKDEQTPGKLSVVTDIDSDGNLKKEDDPKVELCMVKGTFLSII